MAPIVFVIDYILSMGIFYERVKEIVSFLCGKELGEISARAFFPTTNPEVDNNLEGINSLYWLGRDFLMNTDIGTIKKEVEEAFNRQFKETGGVV